MKNNSPWIYQLNQNREIKKLSEDLTTDVAVIGAGIAGVATSFFLLKHTDHKVILLEGYKLAHGATGHNAGQVASYFERPFRDIVTEFGLDMACQGEKSFETAWDLLDDIYTKAELDIPLYRFQGYSGYSTKEQVFGRLENDFLRRKGGLRTHSIQILEESGFLSEIPDKYRDLFSIVSREEITTKLETSDPQYIAITASQKGVINSALFCQEVVQYLIEEYPDRFLFFEHTPVAKVVLKIDRAVLDATNHTVECDKIILCTNGFEKFEIISPSGLTIDRRFHHKIEGVVGFMSGYLEKHTGIPAAISYFQKINPGITDNPGDPYFYVTRRPFEFEENTKHDFVSIGGPDFVLKKRSEYHRDLKFSDIAYNKITNFMNRTYNKANDLKYTFMWHGLMGYTKNLIRMIGSDPEHSHLFYNLGCNGVGILLSIFGGDKVARMIAGEKFPSSIFDVNN